MPSTNTQNIYIQINPGNVVSLYSDAAGTQMLNPPGKPQVPQAVKAGGKFQFNFIRSAANGELVVGDVVVISQTVSDTTTPGRSAKDSPFAPPNPPVYYLPAPPDGNTMSPDGSVPVGSLNIRGNGTVGASYKFSIVVLAAGGTQFLAVDPTVIINP